GELLLQLAERLDRRRAHKTVEGGFGSDLSVDRHLLYLPEHPQRGVVAVLGRLDFLVSERTALPDLGGTRKAVEAVRPHSAIRFRAPHERLALLQDGLLDQRTRVLGHETFMAAPGAP